MRGSQYTESQGHAGYPVKGRRRSSDKDVGGPFHSQERIVIPTAPSAISVQGPVRTTEFWLESASFHGVWLPCDPALMVFPSQSIKPEVELNAYGATAIARCAPKSPVGSLLNTLIEVKKEGIPKLPLIGSWKHRSSTTMSAAHLGGSEYLNAQFGWKPLVDEVSTLVDTITHTDKVIQSYLDGVGKSQRRTYSFPGESSTDESLLVNNTWGVRYPQGGSELTLGGTPGKCYKTFSLNREIWFNGAFTYFIPESLLRSALGDKFGILAQQMGLDITPEVIYNATPWTWGIDWFTNLGDVITNYSRFTTDGLVMSYGYLMEHTIASNTYALRGARLSDGTTPSVPDIMLSFETKRRIEASPYGFGSTFDGLSGFQKSIMAALGLTKIFR